jgi:hypothetical protein
MRGPSQTHNLAEMRYNYISDDRMKHVECKMVMGYGETWHNSRTITRKIDTPRKKCAECTKPAVRLCALSHYLIIKNSRTTCDVQFGDLRRFLRIFQNCLRQLTPTDKNYLLFVTIRRSKQQTRRRILQIRMRNQIVLSHVSITHSYLYTRLGRKRHRYRSEW